MKKINEILLKSTEKIIDEKMSNIYYDKTFPSVIYGKNDDGTYKIVREGQIYNVPCTLGYDLKISQSVWVTMPSGQKNLKDMYISGIRGENKSPITTGGGSGSAEVTKQSIIDALGYTPSSKADISSLQSEITDIVDGGTVVGEAIKSTFDSLGNNISETYAKSSYVSSSVSGLQSQIDNKVPNTRTVNGKALSANISLTASDVGADVSGSAAQALASAKEYNDMSISILEEAIGNKASKAELDTHTCNSTIHITAEERERWNNNSGGNADTLDGLHASDFRQKTKAAAQTLPTPTEECDYLVACNDNTFPYPFGHLQIRYGATTDEFVATFQTTGDFNKLYITKYRGGAWQGWIDLTAYLPLDGSVPMSGFLKASGGVCEVGGDGNHASIGVYNTPSDYSNSRRLMLMNSNYIPDHKDALQFWDNVNGAVTPYVLLHTGNYANYCTPSNIGAAKSGHTHTSFSNVVTFSGGVGGSEGGQIELAKPASGSSFGANIAVDVFANAVRIIGQHNSATKVLNIDFSSMTGSHTAIHSGNYNSYSPTLTGTGASGTWGINITGNANTANSATSATNAGTATSASHSNQLQAFTGDDFTGGDHFVKAIRGNGWSTHLWMCYNGGSKQSDSVSVNYANSAGAANTANYAAQGHLLRTYSASGASHGESWLLKAQHSVKGNGYFDFVCGDGSVGVQVDRAVTAGSAESVTWANVSGKPSSYTPASHNQAASTITAGTFGATGVVAATGTDYTTNRIRNTVFTTTDPGAGASTSYANGSIICVYE